jgi:hypothetical protein
MSVIPKMCVYLAQRRSHGVNQRNRAAGQFECAEIIRPGGQAGQERPRQKAITGCVEDR